MKYGMVITDDDYVIRANRYSLSRDSRLCSPKYLLLHTSTMIPKPIKQSRGTDTRYYGLNSVFI
jgi:hypothetical protein